MPDFVYLDNAATTFPKPPEVIRFMCDFYQTKGVNPGRTGFDLALEAEQTLVEARRALTDFFGGTDANRLVFSYNVTDARRPRDHDPARAQLGPASDVPPTRARCGGRFRSF